MNPFGLTPMEEGVCDSLLQHMGDAVAAAVDLQITPKAVDNAAERARLRLAARSRTAMLLAWSIWRARNPKDGGRAHQCITCDGLGFIVRRA